MMRPEADYPPWDGRPRRSIVVCTQQRSGSTLLGEAMTFAGGWGNPLEYLHFGFRPDFEARWKTRDLTDYAAHLYRLRTDPSGTFSLKLFWRDVADVLREMDLGDLAAAAAGPARNAGEAAYVGIHAALSALLPDATFVFLTRRDAVRQGISHAIAQQTKRWRSYVDDSRPPPDEPVYNFHEVVQCMAMKQNHDAHWRNFFRVNRLIVHEIVYEDLSGDYEGALRRLFGFLGRPRADIATPRLRRNDDARVEAWRRAFLRDFHARARR